MAHFRGGRVAFSVGCLTEASGFAIVRARVRPIR